MSRVWAEWAVGVVGLVALGALTAGLNTALQWQFEEAVLRYRHVPAYTQN